MFDQKKTYKDLRPTSFDLSSMVQPKKKADADLDNN